jgi:hypothetical protein
MTHMYPPPHTIERIPYTHTLHAYLEHMYPPPHMTHMYPPPTLHTYLTRVP